MSTEPQREEGFVIGQSYDFDPPVETNCVLFPGGDWTRKTFSHGWCLKYDAELGHYVFQGKPVGEKMEHFFTVNWGKGSAAEIVSPRQLRAVE